MSRITPLLCAALLVFGCCLAFGQSRPNLFIDELRLLEIRAAADVEGSSHWEMLSALRADVDAEAEDVISGGDRSLPGRSYARGFLAKKAAMVYAVTLDQSYAQIAYDALAVMYSDPLSGNVLPDGIGGKGLERATVGKAFAVAYDLAYNGWTQAQRDFVKGKIQSALDYWQGDGFNFDNNIHPYASNWVAVCYGTNILQMLVLGEHTHPDRQAHYDLLVNRLNLHMSHYGNQGWTQEGNYYMTYAQQFLIPTIHALRRAGDTRLNARVAEKGMWRIPMYGGMFDAGQRATQWGVGGADFGRQGWTSMVFAIVPEAYIGAYRWFYDRHRGILNPAPLSQRYDPQHAGTIYAMMFYPESVASVDPASLLPLGLQDNFGGYWFRNRWQDANDVIVSLSADTSQHGNAWDEADALQINIMGFGSKFAGGPGTSRDARFFSQVTVDGQARASQSATGTREFFAVSDTGGYAIAGGGSKFGGLGISFSRRHLFVSYPTQQENIAIVSTYDVLHSLELREYAWQLNEQGHPLFTGLENGVPTFTLRGEGDGYLKGWILYPGNGTFSNGNPLSYSFEGNDVQIWVVMAMGQGAAPEAHIHGSGLNAEVTIGQRKIRWNAGTQRIEEMPAAATVAGFNMTPRTGTAPLAVTFTPTLPGGNPQWDFGDGNTSTAVTPTHTFQNGGLYRVTLTQNDGSGGTLRATDYVNVRNNAPLALVSATPDKGEPPLTVSFDASASSDPDGHALSFVWDFGDGSAAATGASVSHTYTAQGTYFASVTVSDGHGGVSGAVRRIEVGNQAPTATFTHGATFGIPPVTVAFNASGSSDPEGDTLTYTWNFGDGNTGSGISPSHTFTHYGSFDVVLTVHDGQGNTATATRTIRIQNLPPIPAFTFTPASGNAPLTVTFNASGSSDPEGQPLTYAWDFGDGNTGSGVTTAHTFSTAMNIQVQLTVTDAQGASSSVVRQISILDAQGRRAPDFALETAPELLPGVVYQLFNAATWGRTMGNINTLTAQTEGVLPAMDIRFRQQADEFAFRFTGYIKVPETGSYTFRARVRDNLHFNLGGLQVINTGTGKKFSGPVTVEQTVQLAAGYHAFEARFHASDSNAGDWFPLLSLGWSGPDFAMRSLMPEDLFWLPGRPIVDFMVSPDASQMMVPGTVNFIPADPVGIRTFYQTVAGQPLTLNFDAGPAVAPDGQIIRYLWNFGNGAVGAGRAVSQAFAAGEHVVTLTVETDQGAVFTVGRTLRILPPPARIDFGRDTGKRLVASGQFSPATGVQNLFDGSTSTRWLVNDTEGFVEVHFDQGGRRYGYVIDEYTLTNPPAWNDRDPKDVVFSGTLDGVNWQVIDVRTNINWEGRTRHTMSFPVTNSTAFTGYRWHIVPQAESPQGWFVELYRIQLFASAGVEQPEVRMPTADFSAPAYAEVRQPVVLDASSSISPDGYPLMYFWDFGNGQTLRTVTPSVSHRYFDEGTFQVRLRVRDTLGNLHSSSAHNIVVGPNSNNAPVATFTVTQVGDLFEFDATASYDPDGDPITFRWDFGNGISSVGGETSHRFNPGLYAVTLTVRDNRGGVATVSHPVDARPTALLREREVIAINFTTGLNPLHLQPYEFAGAFPTRNWNNFTTGFSGQLTDNHGNPVPLEVTPQQNRSFQNNTRPVNSPNARVLSTAFARNGNQALYTLGQIPYFTYDLYVYFAGTRATPPQTQRITVNDTSKFIRDDTGGWNGLLEESVATTAAAAFDGPAYVVFRNLSGDSLSIRFDQMSDPGAAAIQIVNTALPNVLPNAQFAISTLEREAPLTITFDASASNDPDGQIVLYEWDFFGDGNWVAGSVTANFHYEIPGEYQPALRVTDNRGGVDIFTTTLTLTGDDVAPVILAQPLSQTIAAGFPVTLSVLAQGFPIPQFQWYGPSGMISGATERTYNIAAMSAAHAGEYYVTINNRAGTATSTTATLTLIQPPAAPGGLQATVLAHNAVRLTWNAVSGIVDGYEIRLANGTLLATVGPDVLFYDAFGLSPETLYNFTVRAFNDAGPGADSDPAQATTNVKLAWQYLINFGDTLYSQDPAGRAWQSFRLRNTVGTDSAKREHSNVLLADSESDSSRNVRVTITSDVTTLMGQMDSSAVLASFFNDSPFAWFTASEGPQREVPAFNETGKSWTYTFNGFDPSETVIFEMVIRRTGNSRPVSVFFNPGQADAVTLLSAADSGITRYLSHEVSGASSYTFTVRSDANDWVAAFNAMAVTVLSSQLERQSPVVNTWPQASNLDEGQVLGDATLTGGSVVDAQGISVPGSFFFVAPEQVATVGTAHYALRFVPTDSIRFTVVTGEIPVTTIAAPVPFYRVTYVGNGQTSGSAPSDGNEYTAGATVTVLGQGTLVRTIHTFAGWNTAADGSGTHRAPGSTFTMPAADVTLFAQWEAIDLWVSPFVENFAHTNSASAAVTARPGWFWAVSDGGTRDSGGGRQFGNMSNAKGRDGREGIAYNYNNAGGNRAIVTWYDIVEQGQSMSQEALSELSMYIGHNHIDNESRFLIRIHTVSGPRWFVSTTRGQTANIGAVGSFATSSDVIRFSLPFTTSGSAWHELAFDGLVGSVSNGFPVKSGTLTGLSGNLPAGSITAVGTYHFNRNNSSTRYDDFTISWDGDPGQPLFVLSFDSAGGSTLDAQLLQSGSDIVPPPVPIRAGYSFIGWSPALPATMPANDLSVTAQWSVNSYTLSFNSNGGSVVAPITAAFGATITPPADPQRLGFDFVAWDPVVPGTMPDQNLTLTAVWQERAIAGTVYDPFSEASFSSETGRITSVLTYGPVDRTTGSGTFGVNAAGWIDFSHASSSGASMFTAALPSAIVLAEGDAVQVSIDFRSTNNTGGHRVLRFGLFESGASLDATKGFFLASPNATGSSGGSAQLVHDLSTTANDFRNTDNPGSGVRTETSDVVVPNNEWRSAVLTITKTANGYRLEGSIAGQTLSQHTVTTAEVLHFNQIWFGIHGRAVTFDIDNVRIAPTVPPTTYTVFYDPNGASGTAPLDGNVYQAGASVTVLGQGNMSNDNATFAGWLDAVSGTLYQPGDAFVMPDRNVILRAQWTPITSADPFADWMAQFVDVPVDQRGLTDTPAGDGISNLLKFAFGLDPMLPGNLQMPRVEQILLDGQLYLALRFRQIIGGSGTHGVDYTAEGLIYAVERSSDLLHWTVSAEAVIFHSIQPTDDPDIAEVWVRSTVPLSQQPHQFLRLRISKQ